MLIPDSSVKPYIYVLDVRINLTIRRPASPNYGWIRGDAHGI